MELSKLFVSPVELNAYVMVEFIAVGLLGYLVWLAFQPLNRIKLWHELGYRRRGRFSRKEAAELRKKSSDEGRPPPPYPNGWYALVESKDLPRQGVSYASAAGSEWVVFRSSGGKAFALDAYCPHLGADLSEGGRVVQGDCLQCPFHGWRFRGEDGRCVGIPYSKGPIPEAAKVKSHRCEERNGHVYVWFHADGEEPTYEIPLIHGLSEMAYKGRTEHWIATHIEDLPENASDLPHLNFIHTPYFLRGTRLEDFSQDFGKEGTGHFFDANWRAGVGAEAHTSILTLTHRLLYKGMTLPLSEIRNRAVQIGPSVVHLHLDLGPLGKATLVHNLLPVGAGLIRCQQHFYTSPWLPTPIAKLLLLIDCIQMERDVVVWNNKRYLKNPVFVKEDAPIAKHRRWFSQFFSEGSQAWAQSKVNTLDW